MNTPNKIRTLFLTLLMVTGACFSLLSLAQTKPNIDLRPEVLSVMNRDIAIFRAPLNGASPAIRVENALKRINQIETIELSEEIRAVPFTLANEKGFQFHLGNRHLFSLIEKDVDTEANQQMNALIEQTTKILEELKTAKLQQGKLSFMIHESMMVLIATIALIGSILVVRWCLNWVGHFLLMKCRKIALENHGVHWIEYFLLF